MSDDAVRSALRFSLKVPGTDAFEDFRAVSISARSAGTLRLDGDTLTIAWGGVATVQEVGALSVRDERHQLSDMWVGVPVGALASATVAGGWMRPRLVVQARERETLVLVPSEAKGAVAFWIARGDRRLARELAAAINASIAVASAARSIER